MFTKEDFLQMGVALGDVYLLLEHFSAVQNTTKKDLLNHYIDETKKVHHATQRKKPSVLTIHFVWFHFNIEKQRYAQVRVGGGKRTKMLDRNSTKKDIFEVGKNFFS